MEMKSGPILFAGPTLAKVEAALLTGVRLCPPIRRGDVHRFAHFVNGLIVIANLFFCCLRNNMKFRGAIQIVTKNIGQLKFIYLNDFTMFFYNSLKYNVHLIKSINNILSVYFLFANDLCCGYAINKSYY